MASYGKLMEEYLAKGKTTAQAHKIASSPIMKRKDKFDKPSWVDKVILKRLRKKAKKKVEKVELRPKYVSARHKTLVSGLSRSGLTDAELKRLTGK